MRISDCSSDVCSSDLPAPVAHPLDVFVLPILVVAEHKRIDRRLSQPVAPFRFPGDQADDLAIVAQRQADEVGAEASEDLRTEERRVGKECVSKCRSGWSAYH